MTAKKVVVNVPGMDKGAKVEVLYLGMFENGGTHDLTDEQVAQYEAAGQRQFPSSGYLFAGEPHGDVQIQAHKNNTEEGIISTRTTELVPTQVDGIYSNPQTDKIEGVEETNEGDKK